MVQISIERKICDSQITIECPPAKFPRRVRHFHAILCPLIHQALFLLSPFPFRPHSAKPVHPVGLPSRFSSRLLFSFSSAGSRTSGMGSGHFSSPSAPPRLRVSFSLCASVSLRLCVRPDTPFFSPHPANPVHPVGVPSLLPPTSLSLPFFPPLLCALCGNLLSRPSPHKIPPATVPSTPHPSREPSPHPPLSGPPPWPVGVIFKFDLKFVPCRAI